MDSMARNALVPKRIKRVLVATSLLFLVIVYPFYIYYDLQRDVQDTGREVTSLLQSKIDRIFNEMEQVLELPSYKCDQNTIQALRRASFYSPHLSEFGLFNSDYRVVCTDYGVSDFPIFRSIRNHIESADNHRLLSIALSKSIKERALFAFLYDPERGMGANGLAPPSILEDGVISTLGDNFNYRIAVGLEVLGQHNVLLGSTLIKPYESVIRSVNIVITLAVKDRVYITTLLSHFPLALFVVALFSWMILTGFKVQATRTVSFDNSVRRAIANRDIDVYFQPIVDTKTHQVYAGEALLRWQSERFGKVEPTRIVSVAAKYGLMLDLTSMIIRRVGRTYRDHKGVLDSIPIFVNLDLETLNDDRFIEGLRDVCDLYPELEGRMGIETHGLYLQSNAECKSTIQVINTVRLFGIAISVDDFGFGYSDTRILKSTPMDALKLDRRFVSRITQNEKSNSDIIKQALSLTHERELKLIAEGVESQEQLNILNALGVRYIQGYHYNRALPEREFVKAVMNKSMMFRSEKPQTVSAEKA
ncbi:EAL domain-containing protein [Marinomonas balearica]|uniref:cyclic-guanylate-specific phosphodiesterase n=1 Tax=Marinomonas balearica TaxID=491947 RepID=A0A4R6M3J9_9GAMM|nr:EAL domain-containing protein [Marinomonas balearica]TDO95857.1 EAL domain-containing protein (putative c-di-GMP-specific phosphodiesterase class I) [Marinomonas balearica]